MMFEGPQNAARVVIARQTTRIMAFVSHIRTDGDLQR